MQASLEAHVQQRIDALGYDFNNFTLDHFLTWVGERRGHPVLVFDVNFTSTLFGFWCPMTTSDYIFVKAHLHPAHRIHVVLHESAHMLLDHAGVQLADVFTSEQLRQLDQLPGKAFLRAPNASPQSATEEHEAECFVALIQRELLKLSRLRELYGEGTSIPALKPYARGLDFTG